MLDALYKDIGDKIREVRETKLRISQDELAKRAGISRPSVANIEKGRQQISVGQLFLFSNVLGVSVDDLLPKHGQIEEAGSLADALPADLDPDLRTWVNSL